MLPDDFLYHVVCNGQKSGEIPLAKGLGSFPPYFYHSVTIPNTDVTCPGTEINSFEFHVAVGKAVEPTGLGLKGVTYNLTQGMDPNLAEPVYWASAQDGAVVQYSGGWDLNSPGIRRQPRGGKATFPFNGKSITYSPEV
jgi:hypothetical protein